MIKMATGAWYCPVAAHALKCFWTLLPWIYIWNIFTPSLGILQKRNITAIPNKISVLLLCSFRKWFFEPSSSGLVSEEFLEYWRIAESGDEFWLLFNSCLQIFVWRNCFCTISTDISPEGFNSTVGVLGADRRTEFVSSNATQILSSCSLCWILFSRFL